MADLKNLFSVSSNVTELIYGFLKGQVDPGEEVTLDDFCALIDSKRVKKPQSK